MAIETDGNRHRVEGRIHFDHGLPADGVTVRLYQRGYGCTETLLGEVKRSEDGSYSLAYAPAGSSAHLEVRAVGAEGKEVSLSGTRYNAQSREVFNLLSRRETGWRTASLWRLYAHFNMGAGSSAHD